MDHARSTVRLLLRFVVPKRTLLAILLVALQVLLMLLLVVLDDTHKQVYPSGYFR
jgi:hypothetical protein